MIPVLIFKWLGRDGFGDIIILDRHMDLAEFNHVATLFRYVPGEIPFTAIYPNLQGEEYLVYQEVDSLANINANHYLVSYSTVEEMVVGPEIPF